eukprot:4395192-Ditylum_brightwellii.AAC.1
MPIFRDSGKTRGFAFVSMIGRDADKSMQEVNGREFDGRALRVNEVMPKESMEGGGGRGGGYSGGGGGYSGGSRYNGGGIVGDNNEDGAIVQIHSQ